MDDLERQAWNSKFRAQHTVQSIPKEEGQQIKVELRRLRAAEYKTILRYTQPTRIKKHR